MPGQVRVRSSQSLEPTYEGLKFMFHLLHENIGPSLEPTYEGLKSCLTPFPHSLIP